MAHLDGELEPEQMREIDLHLASCAACREAADELAQLSTGLSEMVLQVDATAPAVWRSAPPACPRLTVVRGAERSANGQRRTPARAGRAPRAPVPRSWKWAAAALVMVTGAASAAMVGSPLLRGLRTAPAERANVAATVTPPTLHPAGAIAVRPEHNAMVVTIAEAGAGSRLVVRVTDREDVLVSVSADSTHTGPARFRTGDERVEVRLARAAAVVTVDFPRALRSGRVLADGRVLASVSDGHVDPIEAVTTEGIAVSRSQ
jgi:hypothetical protein